MTASKWLLIIIGMLAGVFTPWQYQVIVMVVLLMAYAACYSLKWLNTQVLLAALFGGLSTGAGLQVLIGYGIKNQIIPMIIAPLLLWLLLRIIFYAAETKYTLQPNLVLAEIRAEEAGSLQKGTSAWAGDNTIMSANADSSGRRMLCEFYGGGEIAMGGPSTGDAIFSNGCAFSGVGPSIVIDDNGRYAAMTLPSRNVWGLLIVDLQEKKVYESKANGFWELDRIEDGTIYGRESPLTSNTKYSLSISTVIETSTEQMLAQDDGWWVLDYPDREAFKKYEAITISSLQGTHRVTFVPDLKPFKRNPFLRHSHPEYTILLDDQLLDLGFTIKNPEALWVDGQAHEKVCDGRFLVIADNIIDFKDAVTDTFSIKNLSVLPLAQGCDANTYVNFSYGSKVDVGNACLLVNGNVLPTSTGWENAEFPIGSWTSPWDVESVAYWDIHHIKNEQARTRIERHFCYTVDLDKYSYVKQLKSCSVIQLINRGNPKHSMTLEYAGIASRNGEYSAFTCKTSCGVVLENITHEAIWSHCGRYLAVVRFESQPSVPKQIAILDFMTATIKDVPGTYALPSFIWFDQDMLQFTHQIGVLNTTPYTSSDPRDSYYDQTTTRINELSYVGKEYQVLIEKNLNLFEPNQQGRNKKQTISADSSTATVLGQHCILFAPAFDQPVLQPPTSPQT